MIEYRSAEPRDVDVIAHLHHLVRETSMPYLPPLHTSAESFAFFSNLSQSSKVAVAEADGKIVGYSAHRSGWIDHLYVHPSHQRQGIGGELLKRIKSANQSLELWAFQKNRDAIRFYERFGFKRVRMTDGACNEEREPDALYRWHAGAP